MSGGTFLGGTLYTMKRHKLHVRIARAERHGTGSRHVAYLSRKPHLSANVLVAHVALAPQVEFELLEGMQQQNTSWTRHEVVCIVFRNIVQL